MGFGMTLYIKGWVWFCFEEISWRKKEPKGETKNIFVYNSSSHNSWALERQIKNDKWIIAMDDVKDNINMPTLFQRGQVVRKNKGKQALALAIQEHIGSILSRNALKWA